MKTTNISKTIGGIKRETLYSSICSALEGGSNYWYRIEKFVAPKPEDLILHSVMGNESELSGKTEAEIMKEHLFRHLDYPLSYGGALVISNHHVEQSGEDERREAKLDLESLRKGLEVLKKKYPHHYADLASEDDDACTGDVLLQCCLFGEALYG